MSLLSHSHAIEYTLLFLLKNLKAMGVGMDFGNANHEVRNR